jgi:hypothetical protein
MPTISSLILMENLDSLETRVEKLETKLQSILDRNQHVESEKAWETSNTRRLTIVATTYTIMSIILYVIGVNNPMINAIIPTLGYFLSTLYLKSIKAAWIKKRV